MPSHVMRLRSLTTLLHFHSVLQSCEMIFFGFFRVVWNSQRLLPVPAWNFPVLTRVWKHFIWSSPWRSWGNRRNTTAWTTKNCTDVSKKDWSGHYTKSWKIRDSTSQVKYWYARLRWQQHIKWELGISRQMYFISCLVPVPLKWVLPNQWLGVHKSAILKIIWELLQRYMVV